MDSIKKVYTFYWFIENYSCCWHKNGKLLISPSFTVDQLENTTWKLELYPRGEESEDEGHISVFLRRTKDDDGPRCITLDYELLVLKADGSALEVSEFHYVFKKDMGYGPGEFLETDVLLRKHSEYLPQDILRVCCKMWKGNGNIYNIGQTSARTRIRVEKNSFLHTVENFSKLHQNAKLMRKIRSQSKRERFITSSLYFSGQRIMIDIELSDTDRILCKCVLSLLDASGIVIECGEIDNRYDAARKTSYTLPLSLTKEEILNRKTEYLPGDKLFLICKCTFSPGIELQTIEETIDDIPLVVIEKQTSYVARKTDDKATETLTTYPSVSEDVNVTRKTEDKATETLTTYPTVSEDVNVPRKTDDKATGTLITYPIVSEDVNFPRKTEDKATETLSTYPTVSEDANVCRKDMYKDSEKLSTYPNISEDIKALYINQCLTDVEVKTKTKSFQAHKTVLCARSPVFRMMMTYDMKEKITDCIRVDDIENDIVQQLLLFLNSDNIDDLHWSSATQLYYAADKYQIGRLKELCSSFLLENLSTTNAGELLLLADTHSDSDLKKSVENFILKHEEEIFVSREWEMLMETNPLLVMGRQCS